MIRTPELPQKPPHVGGRDHTVKQEHCEGCINIRVLALIRR